MPVAKFVLANPEIRARAVEYVRECLPDFTVSISPPKRSLAQNAKFHAICNELAFVGSKWDGKERSPLDWKILLVSGHSIVTKSDNYETVIGLEGELVILRESTAEMSSERLSSLIEYSQALLEHIKNELHKTQKG